MIDRRVQILEGPRKGETVAVSDLRPDPFVVLLGEPGIGKTTVLETEAAVEGAAVVKVRELINETVGVPEGPLFLDALDEYRVGSSDLDKVHLLTKAIRTSGATRWRLTCRSEDWQKAADIAAIGRTTGDAAITVAQILPLDITETLAVLQELGEADADAFVDRAYAMGAGGLLESPLSLKLLRNAVAGGQAWPASRFSLFEQATVALAHEDNAVHRLDRTRTSPTLILAAARKACMFMLVTGSRFLWRSGALPPTGDARAYLSADALGLERQVIDDMLDSALFRGEGEEFEPIHRSVAEFLGASALAQAIVGDATTAAFPLGRAKALITGTDGRAPTDLRGLYAWLAAHLAVLGAAAQAGELAEADAVSVLVNGDAAGFDSATKRSLLANLDRHDPYFRASEVGATAVGGLACEDLSDDFHEALTNGDGSHRMMTVYEVLTAGQPVLSLRPLLRTIALDPARPEWQRTRALTAWLNGAQQPDQSRRELFDTLATEAPSAARESLRAELLGSLPAKHVSVADFTSVIADFQVTPDDSTILRLWGLQQSLVADPRPELFDEPFDWLPDDSTHRRRSDVEQLINRALAAVIRSTPDLSGERLWRWLTHARDNKWTNLGDEARPAVSEWLEGAPSRDVELFDAVLATDDSAEGPWVVGTNFFIVAGAPGGGVLDHLREKAMAARGPAKRRLLLVTVNVARRYEVGADAYWRLYDFLAAMKRGNRKLLKTLTICEVEGWRRRQQVRESRHRAQRDDERETNNRKLRQLIPEMAHGQRTAALSWAAQIYFHPQDKKAEGRSSIERLAYAIDDDVLDAVLQGWRQLATHDVLGIDPCTLGKAEAERRSFHSENGAIAGLDRLRTEATAVDLTTLPLTLAIIVLRSGWIAHGSGSKGELEAWAWDRLNIDPSQGSAALVDFWEAVLAGGYAQSSAWQWASAAGGGEALRGAVDTMLARHPAMYPDILRALLASAAPRMERSDMARLAADALANDSVTGKQRAIWSVAAFMTDPLHQQGKLTGHADADLHELFNGRYYGGLAVAFRLGTDTEQSAIASAIFRLVAPVVDPHVEWRRGPVTDNHRLNETANDTLNRLSASSDQSATAAISGLQAGVAAYPAWEAALRHAAAQQARARRDREFVPPDAAAVAEALSGRAPLNGADLRAILVDELRRFGRELRTGSTSNWRDSWNTNSAGKATDPKIENIARDITLGRLQERLAKYRLAIALPEAQHQDDTRADLLIASGAGRTLPIEAKRHYHMGLWTAASGQLQGYTAGDTSDGFGILLVFWYGDVASTPPRADGKTPDSAAELEQLLIADLPDELAAKTDVIVLDVSATDRKGAAASAKPRRATNSTEGKATGGKKLPAKRVKAG